MLLITMLVSFTMVRLLTKEPYVLTGGPKSVFHIMWSGVLAKRCRLLRHTLDILNENLWRWNPKLHFLYQVPLMNTSFRSTLRRPWLNQFPLSLSVVTERYSQGKLTCLLTFCLLINSSEGKQCVNFQVEIWQVVYRERIYIKPSRHLLWLMTSYFQLKILFYLLEIKKKMLPDMTVSK